MRNLRIIICSLFLDFAVVSDCTSISPLMEFDAVNFLHGGKEWILCLVLNSYRLRFLIMH